MAEFQRRFSLERLLALGDRSPGWFDDLLSLWRPAGQAAGEFGLRLAVRNNYLNFYRRGQSVARVCFGRGGIMRAEVHVKYVRDLNGDGSFYCKLVEDRASLPGGGQLCYHGLETLRQWVLRAGGGPRSTEGYSGAEKRFVDEVVAQNSGIIDLEMGLPASLADGGKPKAPRMDIVALEPGAAGLRLVFWEAKLMRDGRLRASGAAMPEVIEQLDRYRKWVLTGSNASLVKQSYRENCAILFNLHKRAQGLSGDVGSLGEAIVAALIEGIAEVDISPRLLIEDRNRSASWAPHADKLNGIAVHYVRSESDGDLTIPLAA